MNFAEHSDQSNFTLLLLLPQLNRRSAKPWQRFYSFIFAQGLSFCRHRTFHSVFQASHRKPLSIDTRTVEAKSSALAPAAQSGLRPGRRRTLRLATSSSSCEDDRKQRPAARSSRSLRRRSQSPSSGFAGSLRISGAIRLCVFVCWSLLALLIPVADACSTRPSPKPRPLPPSWLPDGLIDRENCTDDYATLYCLNDGICFRTKVVNTFIISCECGEGWYGKRCEYKDTPDRFLSSTQRRRIETASVAGGVTILAIVLFFATLLFYVIYRRRKYPRVVSDSTDSVPRRPFMRSPPPLISLACTRTGQAHRHSSISSNRSNEDLELAVQPQQRLPEVKSNSEAISYSLSASDFSLDSYSEVPATRNARNLPAVIASERTRKAPIAQISDDSSI